MRGHDRCSWYRGLGEARLGGTKRQRMQVPQDRVAVSETDAGRRDLAGDHLGGLVEEVAVVRRAPRVAEHDPDP